MTGLWFFTWQQELCVSLPELETAAKYRSNDTSSSFAVTAALQTLILDEHCREFNNLCLTRTYHAVSDLDLEYVADAYAAPRTPLQAWRQRAVGALRELKRRWEGVTLHLHSFQEPAVRQVTRQRDIGFIALLMIFTSWADTSFPYGPTGWSEGCQRWDMHRRMASFLNSQLR